MRALVIGLAAVLVAGCGTNDPFGRGEVSPVEADEEPIGGDGGTDGGIGGAGGGGVGVSFTDDVDPILADKCSGCHAGAVGGLTITGDPAADYDAVIDRVTPGDPENSLLLSKARGESHGGGAILSDGDADYSVIDAWIAAGAENN